MHSGAKTPLLVGSMLMYGSYFYLFVEFAVLRFIVAPRRRAAKLAAMGKTPKDSPAPTVTAILKKMSSIVKGQGEEEDEATEEEQAAVPLLRPVLTPQTSAYSYHFELPADDAADAAAAAGTGETKRGVDRKKLL